MCGNPCSSSIAFSLGMHLDQIIQCQKSDFHTIREICLTLCTRLRCMTLVRTPWMGAQTPAGFSATVIQNIPSLTQNISTTYLGDVEGIFSMYTCCGGFQIMYLNKKFLFHLFFHQSIIATDSYQRILQMDQCIVYCFISEMYFKPENIIKML